MKQLPTKFLASVIYMGVTSVEGNFERSMNGIPTYVKNIIKELKNVNIEDEYEKINNGKSSLSRKMREAVVAFKLAEKNVQNTKIEDVNLAEKNEQIQEAEVVEESTL